MKIGNVNSRGLGSAMRGFVAGFVVVLVALEAGAHTAPQHLPPSANELVRRVVANELKPDTGGHYSFRTVRVRADGTTETRQVIETKDAVLARLLAINGKPLTPAQRDKEDKRLARLVNDPSALASKREQQREDDKRVRKMVGALPDAFTYEYAGPPQGDLVTLKFTPNPSYDPPSRELQVYTGMQGDMIIDLRSDRIKKIDGTLFRDVSFGWGILGRLNRGGKFIVEQADVDAGHWEPTHMVLDFTGKILLVKSLRIKSDETSNDYRRVPDDLTIAQGLEMLKKAADGMLAENSGQK